MSLELSLILGRDAEESTIMLFGFLQQHSLFGAFSGNLPGVGGIEFLSELATVFAMIGLLVLIFSPALWKAKYILSWFFIFTLIILGGALGNTFGYHFSGAKKISSSSVYNISEGNACTHAEIIASGGECHRNTAVTNALIDAFYKVNNEYPGTTFSNVKAVDEYDLIEVDNKNQPISIDVVGFYPQVFAIYITNKLALYLESAFDNFNSHIYDLKRKLMQNMANARLPESQMQVDLGIFEAVCGGVTQQMGIPIEDAFALNEFEAGKLLPALYNRQFTFKDAPALYKNVDTVTEKDPTTIRPLISIENNSNPLSKRDYNKLMSDPTPAEQVFLDLFAVDKNIATSTDDPNDKMNFKNFENSDLQDIKERLVETANAKKANPKAYENAIQSVLDDKSSVIDPNTPISLVLAQTEVGSFQNGVDRLRWGTNAKLDKTNKQDVQITGSPSTNYLNTKENVNLYTNCGDLYTKIANTHEKMLAENVNKFPEKVVNDALSSCEEWGWGQQDVDYECFKISRAKGLADFGDSNELDATFYNLAETISKSCPPDQTAMCRAELEKLMETRKKADVANFLRDLYQAKASENDIKSGVDSGITSVTSALGSGLTQAFASKLTGLVSLKESFHAGAYKVLLPVFKNIMLAFILVCTPILLLLGLLIPAWAPGVIVTTIMAVLFLQMTDVTMVLIDSVLEAINKVFSAYSGKNKDQYEAMMEIIWAMSYMAVFGITAFLMFAAGNTKAIMGKLAGLDSTVKDASKQISNTGLAITAGALSGGQLGGALGAKTAGLISKGVATAKIGSEEGVAAAWNSLGSVGGAYRRQIASHMEAGYDTIKTEAEDEFALGSDLDPTTGKQKSRVTIDHNKKMDMLQAEYGANATKTNAQKIAEHQKAVAAKHADVLKQLGKNNSLSGRPHSAESYTDQYGNRVHDDTVYDILAGDIVTANGTLKMKIGDVSSAHDTILNKMFAAEDKNGNKAARYTLGKKDSFTYQDEHGKSKTLGHNSRVFMIPEESYNKGSLTTEDAKKLGIPSNMINKLNKELIENSKNFKKGTLSINGKDDIAGYGIQIRDGANMAKSEKVIARGNQPSGRKTEGSPAQKSDVAKNILARAKKK